MPRKRLAKRRGTGLACRVRRTPRRERLGAPSRCPGTAPVEDSGMRSCEPAHQPLPTRRKRAASPTVGCRRQGRRSFPTAPPRSGLAGWRPGFGHGGWTGGDLAGPARSATQRRPVRHAGPFARSAKEPGPHSPDTGGPQRFSRGRKEPKRAQNDTRHSKGPHPAAPCPHRSIRPLRSRSSAEPAATGGPPDHARPPAPARPSRSPCTGPLPRHQRPPRSPWR